MTNCIFCKIANKEMGELIYEDDYVAAFNDINPASKFHVLIIPKKHIERLNDVESEEDIMLVGRAVAAAAKIAKMLGIAESGYRLVANCNEDAGQTVWHIHFHLVGGEPMGWPPFPKK